ncbi:DUF2851 family protein [Allomuricauda sp. SCSIO 65647]|uniref:DUF2851 family protein n=1 Tax=Allomuricauda sp. SCSIO 65647 TaxID=2908843 RepID=UPI001F44A6D5|nr:DUF2851 family protein [Muricauda sp. SCSIO 65647]UJH68068.1 DUF2851 family protein [Muricauda sp. SCSIO 65647]
MREDVLHFVWKYQKFPIRSLQTTNGKPIVITKTGIHNHGEGPDFFNARLEIGSQEWAGNVEIHLKSSDWYAHGHESDRNYDNVILHVVWEDDVSVFRKDGTEIPTLELKNYLSVDLLNSYKKLFQNSKKTFINCERDFGEIDGFLLENWFERLFFERLQQKSNVVFELLEHSKNDWEKVLFCLLMKNFGLNTNGQTFFTASQALDFSIIRKISHDPQLLEALFFGMLGLLQHEVQDEYLTRLRTEFDFLKTKFGLQARVAQKPTFFGLRPNNFPTIRLPQLAAVYHKRANLFNEVIQLKRLQDFYGVFDVSASAYWEEHYTFGKLSKKSTKKLTKSFVELLVLNTIVPIKFCYAKKMGRAVHEELIELASNVKAEKNSIIEKFDYIGQHTENAWQSQAKIQLYNAYCAKNRCLQCAVGADLLSRNL